MNTTKPDYKNTICLPKTDFPMKGDLPLNEPKTILKWKENQIYQKMISKNKNNKTFTLPDGPPYANGSIHVGHALNKTLKDIIIKYKNMSGYHAPFIPGWDCHGLPIEHKVMKDLSQKKQSKTNDEILSLCKEEALTWVKTQKEQFTQLGILADWENPYLTLDPSYEAEEIREFARAFKKGVIYRGSKPVYWNWYLQTALADAEVEYHPHKSPSIYVKFPIVSPSFLNKLGNPKGDCFVVIWTTTPWTLPANVAISLHPDYEYGLYKTKNQSGADEFLLIAKDLKDSFEKEVPELSLVETHVIKGANLENEQAQHPWISRDSTIVLGTHVTLDTGTGAVHTAPGHGADDFKVGQKYNLNTLCPVNDKGEFTDEVPEFKGINIFKANPLILEKLKSLNLLVAHKEIEHSYPHCWRSKTPLIFRTTPQWFLGLDLEESQIRQKTLKELDTIQFFPKWGEARLRAMIENRPDWCLSRQRIWGVPIPVFYCKATGEPLADYDVMMKVADVVEKEGGLSAFYKHTPEFFIGTKTFKEKFGSEGFRHGQDILDVWFDSGVCHAAVQKKREGLSFPADLYLEGSDQHRGWFNTSLLSSMTTNGKPPFKALVTHGFVVDSQGRKMSKSLGNVVDPLTVIKNSGAEIIRLWTIYEDYGQDMSCGTAELTRVTETYRRIRNTMRFMLGALSDFDFEKEKISIDKMTPIDQWALHQLYELTDKVTQAYENFEFYKVYHALNVFFTVTLSSVYLDVLKDRLYTWKKSGVERKSSQTVLYLISDSLIRMMAPVLSFLSEELYTYWKGKNTESVFLLDFPKAQSEWKNDSINELFEELLKLRSEVQKELEGLRNQKVIGSSLEAQVKITAPSVLFDRVQKFNGLRELLIVSDFEVINGGSSTLKIEATKAPGEKCIRCWTYSTQISHDINYPDICPKCVEALT